MQAIRHFRRIPFERREAAQRLADRLPACRNDGHFFNDFAKEVILLLGECQELSLANHFRQRVHIGTDRLTTEQDAFERSGPTPAKRIPHSFARHGQSRDEIAGNLRNKLRRVWMDVVRQIRRVVAGKRPIHVRELSHHGFGFLKVCERLEVCRSLHCFDGKIRCSFRDVVREPLRQRRSIFLQNGSQRLLLRLRCFDENLSFGRHVWGRYQQAQMWQ